VAQPEHGGAILAVPQMVPLINLKHGDFGSRAKSHNRAMEIWLSVGEYMNAALYHGEISEWNQANVKIFHIFPDFFVVATLGLLRPRFFGLSSEFFKCGIASCQHCAI
jgi:hypothetical protein